MRDLVEKSRIKATCHTLRRFYCTNLFDVGLEMVERFEGEIHRRCADEERIRTRRVTPSVADDFMVYIAIPENNLLKHIRNRSKYPGLVINS